MLQKLQQFKAKHPFTALMLLAIFIRVLVVIFVPGFGSNHDLQQPTMIQQFLEWVKRAIGLGDSQWTMFLSRLFYATVSLFTVSMVYRISDLISNNRSKAWNIALLPAFCVVMPSFGIIDNVSFFLGLPLLLYGANIIVRQQVLREANMNESTHRSSFIIAGIMLALSVCVWYESALIALVILLMLCMKHNYKGALMTLLGMVVTLLLIWVVLILLNVNPWSYIRL